MNAPDNDNMRQLKRVGRERDGRYRGIQATRTAEPELKPPMVGGSPGMPG